MLISSNLLQILRNQHNVILCALQRHMLSSNFTEFSNYLNGWKDIHFRTEHRLASCFKKQSLKVLEETDVTTTI